MERKPEIMCFNRKRTEVCVGEKRSLLEKFSADSVGEYGLLGINECSLSLREFWSIGTSSRVLEPTAMPWSERHSKSLEDMHWVSAHPVVEMAKHYRWHAFHLASISNIVPVREV
jgi:hypothetical protein